MQLYIALRKFVADSHSCTASHPFLGHRPTNLFLSALFDDTLGLPSVSKAILCFWCGCFCCGSGPFLCCFAVFPAGETQIWPGDLRVVAVLPGFCLCVFGFALNCGTKVLHNVCILFTCFSHC